MPCCEVIFESRVWREGRRRRLLMVSVSKVSGEKIKEKVKSLPRGEWNLSVPGSSFPLIQCELFHVMFVFLTATFDFFPSLSFDSFSPSPSNTPQSPFPQTHRLQPSILPFAGPFKE